MAYNGWRLSEQSKSVLMDCFPPRFADVIAHHVTLKRGNQFCPVAVTARVVGYAVNEAGVEALVVEVNGSTERPDGKTYHITWSIDREAGFKPVSSNTLLENGFTAVEPIEISVQPFYKDHDGVEWTGMYYVYIEQDGEEPFYLGSYDDRAEANEYRDSVANGEDNFWPQPPEGSRVTIRPDIVTPSREG